MIPFLFSILASTTIFVIFRLFARFQIDTFQAIVFNYLTAFSVGFVLYHQNISASVFNDLSWLPLCIMCGILFISLFFLMAISSQQNGVSVTSIAVKMSMALSLIFMLLYYREAITFYKIAGFLLAFLSVTLVTFQRRKPKVISGSWMLIVLFTGSGILDILLNYSTTETFSNISPALFSAFGFAIAAIVGVFILSYRILKRKSVLQIKNVVAGIALGIPNYFSIYLFLLAYREMGWPGTSVLALTNLGIVILSVLAGKFLFKEQLSLLKYTGLLCAIASIIFIVLAQNHPS